jgi:multicomponent K+:H+ antiporter subunit A
MMSLVALVGGSVFYLRLSRGALIRHIDIEDYLRKLQGKLIFEYLMQQIVYVGRAVKLKTETGKLQHYLFWIISFSIVMLLIPLCSQPLRTGTHLLTQAPWIAILLWLLLFSACWMMLWFHHERIKAVLISGAVGLVVTLVFVTLSAPDLALTQITVDVVTTVLLLMSLSLLPQLTPYESTQTQRWRDAIIAIVAGGGVGWISWLILTRDHESISWFLCNSPYH